MYQYHSINLHNEISKNRDNSRLINYYMTDYESFLEFRIVKNWFRVIILQLIIEMKIFQFFTLRTFQNY